MCKPAICVLYICICITLPLRVRQYTLLLHRNDKYTYYRSCYFGLSISFLVFDKHNLHIYYMGAFILKSLDETQMNHHRPPLFVNQKQQHLMMPFVCVRVLVRHVLISPLLLCMSQLTPLYMTNELSDTSSGGCFLLVILGSSYANRSTDIYDLNMEILSSIKS